MKKSLIIALLIGILFSFGALAQNNGTSPSGRTSAVDLYGPFMAGQGGFTTSRGGSQASAINPAAEGDAQRIIFDIGYLGLPNFGSSFSYEIGSLNLGAIIPTRYAVFGGSIWMMLNNHNSFNTGNILRLNLNAAKEIYPGMSIGAGLNIGRRWGSHGSAFTFAGDLGFRYNMGELGPLENFTWALTINGLGMSWIPHSYTPSGGVSFDAFRISGGDGQPDPLRINISTDLSVPTFQNVAGKFGVSLLISEMLNVSASMQFNLGENPRPSFIPSIGISFIWQLQPGGRRIIADRLPSDGDINIGIAARPLYNALGENVWAIGGGLIWNVGVVDTRPPVINVNYPDILWISPNNDGRADALEVPITITDDRYISEWVFEISDETGRPLRVIRNREIRPETQGVQNLIDRIMAVKSGVDVPPFMRWDGVFDSGELAPDGMYFFSITATDDNGNTSSVGPFAVFVDTLPPEIALEPFTNEDNIFSPGGGGDKNDITIVQTGSTEDLWEAGIYDSLGERIRAFSFIDSAPLTLIWDGTDDNGDVVEDGIYSYRISSTDRALNYNEASLENIIVNTIRPPVGISISSAYFSPNNDGILDSQVFSLYVPEIEGIVRWSLEIRDSTDTLSRSYQGTTEIPEHIVFDGYDNSGVLLPEGSVYSVFSVRYRNGYTSSAEAPAFILDISPPRAEVRSESVIFSPFNPDSPLSELVIYQESFKDVAWTGEIRQGRTASAGSGTIRTFRFPLGYLSESISWDGLMDSGTLAPDGFYHYVLTATDQAGNRGTSNTIFFEVDTRNTPIVISTDIRAFSPGTNSPRSGINLYPQLQEMEGIESWRINIFDSQTGTIIRSFEGRDTIPSTINWNGRDNAQSIARDGNYHAVLEVLYRNGNHPNTQSAPFIVDTIPPAADISVPYTLFAPNGNENRNVLPVQVFTGGNDEYSAEIRDAGNQVIRSWNWTGAIQTNSIIWDGRDQAGNLVSDGIYSFELNSMDEAGNSTQRRLTNIELDARVPRIFLTSSAQAIAPRPGQAEAMRFNVLNSIPEGIAFWQLDLVDENGYIIKSFPSPLGGSGIIPSFIAWDGRNEAGIIQEGRFTPILNVSYTKGDVVSVSTPPILVNVTGPALSFYTRPMYFSPDNDGVDDELFIYLGAESPSPIAEWSLEFFETEGTGQLFYRIEGRGSPAEEIIWDGRSNRGELVQSASDYRYVFSARDVLGNASSIEGSITTDVLVIRDGDLLRIMIPSITFRPNHADFIGIPPERLATNEWVLQRLAQILNRFRDYRVLVEGHANPIIGTIEEEINELQPLSLDRARFVIDHLVNNGVARNRLSATGRGGTITVADARDQDNNWKNRRVEFILIR